jgi:hypothetical protein
MHHLTIHDKPNMGIIKTGLARIHTQGCHCKGLALPRVSHSSDIALTGSRHLSATLGAAPALFAHAVVTVVNNKQFHNPSRHRQRGYVFSLWLTCVCMRSKAWLAAHIALRRARMNRTARRRRLRPRNFFSRMLFSQSPQPSSFITRTAGYLRFGPMA